ncbi:MAG TPA: DUF29 domain-containing protein [Stellaceae bacterium]|jgi:hypothetical protein|nr:DUF29 domain-containing protein [Stellaceae bacterium]
MPDGPNPKAPDYDDDFYAWTKHQAAVLREMPVSDNRFDREHVAEEIEDLGNNVRNAMRSQVRRIVEHFLKLQYSPTQESRYGWMEAILDARQEIADNMTATLRREISGELTKLYRDGGKRAAIGLDRYGELEHTAQLPDTSPYTFDQILEDDWYPEPVEKP